MREKIYFTPGPTYVPKTVKDFIREALDNDIGSINHRSNKFVEVMQNTTVSLKKLFKLPDDYSIFFLSSATECMDRIISGSAAERTFHFVNGAFSKRFYDTAVELEKRPDKTEVISGNGFNFDSINIVNEPELICFTHNETSTGVSLNPDNIYKVKEEFPDAIVSVDIVSSAPYVNLDFNKIDSAFFSVQKGFSMPPGLGVMFVNQSVVERAKILKHNDYNIGAYHNILSLYEWSKKSQTTETPNTIAIYVLGKVCEYFINYGIEMIRTETDKKAELLYNFAESSYKYKLFVEKDEDRSRTVIVLEADTKIIDELARNNLVIASGYGEFKESQIRIGNFPFHTVEMVSELIKALK